MCVQPSSSFLFCFVQSTTQQILLIREYELGRHIKLQGSLFDGRFLSVFGFWTARGTFEEETMENGMARSCAHYLGTSMLSFVFRLNLRRLQVLPASFLFYL